ncbi:MAG: hypothetical protein OER04_13480 [Cyclobacteriaceae bacterium]|nr:hypothetical protein [Cyclobacteriaceae bacterium]
MKSLIMVPLLIWGICSVGNAQSGEEFDFWVGKWDLTWDLGEEKVGHGVNNIVKILDGKVIQENFEATDAGPNTGFKGTSISVFNPNTKTWHQAWADNQGGYFNFMGEIDDNRRVFKTQSFSQGDKTIVLRMVFYDIQEDSFTWDWERSDNDGESWSLQWRINYKRAD